MFDKRKDNVRDPAPQREPLGIEERPLSPAPAEQPPAAPKAAIGSTIIIKGELSGDEDVVVSGEFEGNIDLPNHSLTVLRGGQVRANVKANMIEIQGEVQGDVDGVDKVLITKTGRNAGQHQLATGSARRRGDLQGQHRHGATGAGAVEASPAAEADARRDAGSAEAGGAGAAGAA